MKKYISFILLLSLFFTSEQILAQLHVKGNPVASAYHFDTVIPVVINIDTADIQNRKQNTENPAPEFAGITVSLSSGNIKTEGRWIKAENNLYVWRAAFKVTGAQSLNLYFRHFSLKNNDRLFLYSPDMHEVLGAFTKNNNGNNFATGLIKGNELVIEYSTVSKPDKLPFDLWELGVIMEHFGRGFGDAGSCEVPVNCDEGLQWQRQKRGVSRILLKESSSLFWCTGSLVNNTKVDGKPYFLTANHCGSHATEADYNDWVFDFDYESADCNRPATEPEKLTFTGASLIARGTTPRSVNSDFKLLLLNEDIPDEYHMYFNGWDRSGDVPQHGVVIHHPEGDIKFISTYNNPAVSSFYYGSENPDAPFWKVIWSETANGYGVTEGGSSGSPLFNEDGLIVGALTGGDASCINNTGPDYFGKFSESWDQNGISETDQLKPWLDPINSGVTSLTGFYKGTNELIANFGSGVNKIFSGNYIKFTNLSEGNITEYHWQFEGGIPSESFDKEPELILYKNPGTYRVKLVVRSTDNADTLIRNDYITVLGNIYPNPYIIGKANYSEIYILTGDTPLDNAKVYVTDIAGRTVLSLTPHIGSNAISFSPTGLQAGTYIVTTIINDDVTSYKLVIIGIKSE